MTLLPTLSVIVPCYNEAEVLPETATRLSAVVDGLVAAGRLDLDSQICFVDDGSVDRTWAVIEELSQQSNRFSGIRLSSNRGHQNALMAGLLTAPGDLVLSLDADLQDDVNAIAEMLEAHASGAEIVFGVRSSRMSDTHFKRTTAQIYYRLLQCMGVKLIHNHADYRLMSRRAIEALREYQETNLFLRALIPQLGFKTASVMYKRLDRVAGTSKYPLWKMASFALEGITSFSTTPLRLITLLGFFVSVVSLCLGLWALTAALIFASTVPGWASTVIPIYVICGVQMLCLGIIGEYIGKIYNETKRRPRFLIDKTTDSRPSLVVSA